MASLGNTSGTAQGAGNPVHLVTGNKYLTEVDLPALPGSLGIELVRHYNSVHAGPATPSTALGRGWRLSYDTQLAVLGSQVQILQADGSRLVFHRDPADPGRCGSPDPAQGALTVRREADGEHFDWRWPNGRLLTFDARGFLIQVAQPTGELLALQRDGQGHLLRVTDPQGRELRLIHAAASDGETRLVAVETPLGRFEFRHGTPAARHPWPSGPAPEASQRDLRLTSMRRPDGSQRRYHHEDVRFPTLLTGISISPPEGSAGGAERRVSTYAYDASGRAWLTAWGPDEGGPERLLLDHDTPGRTTITDAKGRVTVAFHSRVGGEWRLLRLLGTGCAGCGPSPMSFAYDVLGRIVRETALHPDGRPFRSRLTLRDDQGRLQAIAVTDHRPATADRVTWIEQHHHPADGDASVVSIFPSVVPGRSREVRIERNAAGQITRRVERGFSPLDDQGRPLPAGLDGRVAARHQDRATRIERETRFEYRVINGRSLLHAIDGPLPNGPSRTPVDSDITRLVWDASGSRVIHVQTPGRDPVRLEHEDAGRWVNVVDAEGRLSRSPVGALASGSLLPDPRTLTGPGPAGASMRTSPDSIWGSDRISAPPGAPRLRHLADDFGRVVARLSVDHGDASFTYDPADRLVGMRDASGGQAVYEYDLRGRLVAQQLPGPDGRTQVTRWHWEGNRLQRVDHPVQQEHFRYDGQGRRVARRMSVMPAVHSPHDRSAMPSRAPVEVLTQWRYDDTGRLEAVSLPDGSWLHWRRDPSGQVVALERQRLATRWLSGLLPSQVLASDIRRDRVGVSSIDFGNGLTGRWVRSGQGELARVVHAPSRPLRLRPPMTAAIPAWPLLGLGTARAHQEPPPSPSAGAEAVATPGWLFRPAEASALVDDRLGFDARGNLLVREERGSGVHALWHHRYDAQDRLIASWRELRGQTETDAAQPSPSFHAYDAEGNRVRSRASVTQGVPVDRVIETEDGSHRVVRVDRQAVEHDPMGRPRALRDLSFEWDATGRAVAIHRNRATHSSSAPAAAEVRFGYNHRGERVLRQATPGAVEVQLHDERRRWADLDTDGRITRQWVWLADLPLAVIDAGSGLLQPPVQDASTGALLVRDLRYLLSHIRGSTERLTWLHGNHLGAPVVATDERGQPRWQAEYADFGRATVRSLDGFQLDLRLPGQHEDPETGLHHNDHRLYDPDLGRYLTPDPLGAPDGPNPFVYVRNNPLRYVDPTGLVLWAFDGTANHPGSRTNVWHLAQTYADQSDFDRAHGITGMTHYVSGPGTVRNADGTYGEGVVDAALAGSMNPTLAVQMDHLRSYVDRNWTWAGHREAGLGQPGRPVRILLDVTGFSRGAALAREFSNRVSDFERSAEFRQLYGDCLDIIQRMLALFDTVLGNNLAALGSNPLRMAIPPEVEWVFHAVAMNERRGLFPLESIHQSPADLNRPNLHRVERGFIGAHSDIGGGYSGVGASMTGGDLSDLALMWMIRLAERDAQVRFAELAPHLHTVSSPIVHDPRREQTWTVLGDRFDASREVRFRSPAPTPTPVPQELRLSPDPESRADPSPLTREQVVTVDQRRLMWPHGMSQDSALQGLVERADRGFFDADSHELSQRALCDYIQWLRDREDAVIPIQPGCR